MTKNTCAVVLVMDRLGAGFLGPYGNTWVPTPYINRLASQSLLIEHAVIDSPYLDGLYRSYWRGEHALCGDAPRDRSGLAAALVDAGIGTTLVTDEATVARHPGAGGFRKVIRVQADAKREAARDVGKTHLARLLNRAVEELATMRRPSLLWIHGRAMSGPWDAPRDYRDRMADEEDPVPPGFVDVPNRLLGRDYDPDELLGIVFAYAGQVSALDACVGGFVDALDLAARDHEALFILTSSRGFPLGEHLRVGPTDEALYHELLHVPCITRFPGGLAAAMRSQTLWQPSHMHAMLLDWLTNGTDAVSEPAASVLAIANGDCENLTQRACVVSTTEWAIRTPAWYLKVPRQSTRQSESTRQSVSANDPSLDARQQGYELYVKPDDRWDFNNVATRCPNIAEQMHAQLDLFRSAAHAHDLERLPALPEELLERWE